MIRVLIVDDSAVVRRLLTAGLSKYADIEVVGSAADPYAARDKIVELKPDVVTLDIEMPRMDGLTFLEKLMRHHPIPVVVVSSHAPEDSDTAFRALELGAVEVIAKPGSPFSSPDVDHEFVQAIRAAASARVRRRDRDTEPQPAVAVATPPVHASWRKVVAIGASTGGTQAIETVLRGLPQGSPGTLIVQHMPAGFTAAFARRLNDLSEMEVREAADNDEVRPGVALVAPGDRHMVLVRVDDRYRVRVQDGPRLHHQRPAVDVLFQSVARHAGRHGIGVLLTGMGSDGARGLLAIRESGGTTIAQDEESCVVFGMPKEAIALGAAVQVLPLGRIAAAVLMSLQSSSTTALPSGCRTAMEPAADADSGKTIDRRF